MKRSKIKSSYLAPLLGLCQKLLPPLIQGCRHGSIENRACCIRATQALFTSLRAISPPNASSEGPRMSSGQQQEALLEAANSLRRAADAVGELPAGHLKSGQLHSQDMVWIFNTMARAAERRVDDLRAVVDKSELLELYGELGQEFWGRLSK
jgi:hypothetical protein